LTTQNAAKQLPLAKLPQPELEATLDKESEQLIKMLGKSKKRKIINTEGTSDVQKNNIIKHSEFQLQNIETHPPMTTCIGALTPSSTLLPTTTSIGALTPSRTQPPAGPSNNGGPAPNKNLRPMTPCIEGITPNKNLPTPFSPRTNGDPTQSCIPPSSNQSPPIVQWFNKQQDTSWWPNKISAIVASITSSNALSSLNYQPKPHTKTSACYASLTLIWRKQSKQTMTHHHQSGTDPSFKSTQY